MASSSPPYSVPATHQARAYSQDSTPPPAPEPALQSSFCLKEAFDSFKQKSSRKWCQSAARPPSPHRLERSNSERPYDVSIYQDEVCRAKREGLQKDTVLYLAYGSNLSYETFQGRRGINPLAQINVLVPELRMSFDLPGIPYKEPCFANTARRDVSQGQAEDLLGGQDYHKDRWRKGLVGVVYEVTPADYAHIIATEGGGSAYQDIVVDCYPLEAGSSIVPEVPATASFKAHTLFAPRTPSKSGRFGRPDPSYAQASARYLKLITDGGREHALPKEYQDYLDNIRPYRITTRRQRVGQFAFLSIFLPFIMLIFALMEAFRDKRTGRTPQWLAALQAAVFRAAWSSYDRYFKRAFGDGERTIGDDTADESSVKELNMRPELGQRLSSWGRSRPADIEGLIEK